MLWSSRNPVKKLATQMLVLPDVFQLWKGKRKCRIFAQEFLELSFFSCIVGFGSAAVGASAIGVHTTREVQFQKLGSHKSQKQSSMSWRRCDDVELLWQLACVDMLTWECHERYLQKLFQHLRNEPPEGFVKPTVQQLLRADRQVFLRVIQKYAKVRRTALNTLEKDRGICDALTSYEVGFHYSEEI